MISECASIRSAALSSSVIGSVGHCNPWASISFIRFQREWFLRRGRSSSPLRNFDPYPTGKPTCAANAFSTSKLNFLRAWTFDSAASLFISNLKSGASGHVFSNSTMTSMISIMFLGQIGSASITTAIDWNSFGGVVEALSCLGVLRDGDTSQG